MMSAQTTDTVATAASLGVVDNPPNPARLFKSLRDSGYSNDAAVADLVDNSIDAEATRVRIFVEPETGRFTPDAARIVMADDGRGMTLSVLAEAMKLGSETTHDLTSDLGKYGMGLITAAISIGQRLIVLTKTTDSDLLCAVHDLNIISNRNAFLVELRIADSVWVKLWEQYAVTNDHGTVVIIERCDQLSYSNAGSFTTRLKKHLGQTFRRFIIAKSQLTNGNLDSFLSVNDDAVYAVDPLMLAENKDFMFPKTLDLLQSSFGEPIETLRIKVPVDPNDAGAGSDDLVVQLVNLPDLGQTLSKELDINAPNSGIYVMRNQREIAAAQTLGLFAKAQALTGFRAELHVPATLDKRIGINWTKQRIEPDEHIRAELKRALGPHIAGVRKRYDKKTSESHSVDHKSYEKLISKKAKLLSLPKVRAVDRIRPGTRKGVVTPKGTDIIRTGNGDIRDRIRDRCEFREGHMTASGPLWEPEMVGSRIVLTFNIDHPLWTRFVVERENGDLDKSAVVELLHLFAFCLSTAEFSQFGEEEHFQRLLNMRQQLSNNMRVLLT